MPLTEGGEPERRLSHRPPCQLILHARPSPEAWEYTYAGPAGPAGTSPPIRLTRPDGAPTKPSSPRPSCAGVHSGNIR